jgi:hypothetical protein
MFCQKNIIQTGVNCCIILFVFHPFLQAQGEGHEVLLKKTELTSLVNTTRKVSQTLFTSQKLGLTVNTSSTKYGIRRWSSVVRLLPADIDTNTVKGVIKQELLYTGLNVIAGFCWSL